MCSGTTDAPVPHSTQQAAHHPTHRRYRTLNNHLQVLLLHFQILEFRYFAVLQEYCPTIEDLFLYFRTASSNLSYVT